ncbi:MAG: hypothetical protein M1819_002260 [Sarea resinae]|nr:MAG: hypothetical protein M1819_002260 [Sarea resinae]
MSSSPHTFAARASEGYATTYENYRPSYRPAVVDKLLSELKIANQKGAKILEIGAGTGKFTELLAARGEGYEIIAVEPHVGMMKELEKKALKGVVLKEGNAAHIPADDESVDAVIVAQAFHWFANEDSLKEIHRVLQPEGNLGLIWNVDDYNAPKSWTTKTQYEAKIKEIIWATDDHRARFRHEKWQNAFEGQVKSTPLTIPSADPLFSLPLGEDTVPFTTWLSAEAVWSRLATLSQIAEIPETEQEVGKTWTLRPLF